MAVITVIIPAYNAGKYIARTLRSVVEQTFSDFACIIIDDGSTDATAKISSETVGHDARFRIVRQDNAGECAARNAGMALVRTPLVAMLDSDDVWHPDFLLKMTTALADDGVSVAWCRYAMFFDHNGRRKTQYWDNIHKTGNIWWDMLLDSVFCMGAWAARSDIVRKAGAFDGTLAVAGDRDFLLRMLALVCGDGRDATREIPEELLYYRQRRGSAVRNAGLALAMEWDLMQRHISHAGIPPRIRKRAGSFLAFKMAVIAASAAKEYATAARWYARAFRLDPGNLNLYWLPLRKAVLSLRQRLGRVRAPLLDSW